MKRLKFLIVALGLFATQGVFAVTLPSTSYTPYVCSESYTSSYSDEHTDFRSFVGTYASLSSFDCSSQTTFDACNNCCIDKQNECFAQCQGDEGCAADCAAQTSECQNNCGRSLPLDAPLWFLLASIVILSVAKTLTIYVRYSEGYCPKSLASGEKN